MNEYFVVGFLTFFTGLMGFAVYLCLVKRMYQMLLLFGSLFLLCLISTISKSQSLLIDDNILLQINATIIAGALILITISSLPMVIKLFKTGVVFTPLQIGGGIVGAFSLSMMFIFIGQSDLAKIIDFIGFGWMVFSCLVITFKDPAKDMV